MVEGFHLRQVHVERLFDQGPGTRALKGNGGQLHRLELHLVGDDIAVEGLLNFSKKVTVHIDQELVPRCVNFQVGQDLSLHVEQQGVDSLPRLETLHVVRHHSVQETNPIFAA